MRGNPWHEYRIWPIIAYNTCMLDYSTCIIYVIGNASCVVEDSLPVFSKDFPCIIGESPLYHGEVSPCVFEASGGSSPLLSRGLPRYSTSRTSTTLRCLALVAADIHLGMSTVELCPNTCQQSRNPSTEWNRRRNCTASQYTRISTRMKKLCWEHASSVR